MEDSSGQGAYLSATKLTRVYFFTFNAVVVSYFFTTGAVNPVGKTEVFDFFKTDIVIFVLS